jgi:hypothetical protein
MKAFYLSPGNGYPGGWLFCPSHVTPHRTDPYQGKVAVPWEKHPQGVTAISAHQIRAHARANGVPDAAPITCSACDSIVSPAYKESPA